MRHRSVERIIHTRAIGILNDRRHRVVNIDVVLENTAVALVAVSAFAFGIKFRKTRIFCDVPIKRTLRFVRARPAVRMAKRAVLSVHVQRSVGRHFDRIGIEPPVDQIEMMRRLVNPKAAAARLQTVPATEIIRAVTRIEIPAEIDRRNLADLAVD